MTNKECLRKLKELVDTLDKASMSNDATDLSECVDHLYPFIGWGE